MKGTSSYTAVFLICGLLVSAAVAVADQPKGHIPYKHGSETKLPSGVIGGSLQVWAERIGDPSALYIDMVHPEGPAHKAGIRHGDEVSTVDGSTVTGKSLRQVVKMIRGEPGTTVMLGIKNNAGTRELSITRVASDQLRKSPRDAHKDMQR